MRKLSKKKKIIILLSSLITVCTISVVAMYVTGVLPAQTKGGSLFRCANYSCICHEDDSSFGHNECCVKCNEEVKRDGSRPVPGNK